MAGLSQVTQLDASAAARAIEAYLTAGSTFQQTVRPVMATAVTTNNWTIATTASTSQVAADASRVAMIISVASSATGRVYFRFDSTAPTASVFHYNLEPDITWEVPAALVGLPVSMLGAAAGGSVLTLLATAA